MHDKSAKLASEAKNSCLVILGFSLALLAIVTSGMIGASQINLFDQLCFSLICLSFLSFWISFFFFESSFNHAIESKLSSFDRSYKQGMLALRIGLIILILQPGVFSYKYINMVASTIYFTIVVCLLFWYWQKSS